jgi:hypothetical protein
MTGGEVLIDGGLLAQIGVRLPEQASESRST